jgi:hypothetical protein
MSSIAISLMRVHAWQLNSALTIDADNTVICTEAVQVPQHPAVVPALTTINPQAAQLLPRNVLHAILSTAAVHMAARNPGDRSVGRLALEMKNRFLEGMNNAVQQPQQQRPDVLFVCIALLFAMEVRSNIPMAGLTV